MLTGECGEQSLERVQMTSMLGLGGRISVRGGYFGVAKDVSALLKSPRFHQQPLCTSDIIYRSRLKRAFTILSLSRDTYKVQASDADFGIESYSNKNNNNNEDKDQKIEKSQSENLSDLVKQKGALQFTRSLAGVLVIVTIAATIITVVSGGPSALMAAISKTGFTAAFALIFVSEIGDKTFFIAALLAMQYTKGLVLLGSMGALSLMTIISVLIGRIFQSVPTQFQTTVPIGEYAAVILLILFGLKSIKTAMDLPPESKNERSAAEVGEFVEAEELVKEKVSKKLSTPAEILWKSFSLVFFAEWGDRSMLATIALGAAQSPWGVACGAIGGHLVATLLAILGGGLLAQYISEKVVGYVGGVLFLVFAVATLFGAF